MFETLATVKDIIKMFFISFFLIIYAAACLGVVIFRHNLPSDYDSNIATGDDDDTDDPDVLDAKVKFNTFSQGVLAIFQIAVSNNWQVTKQTHPVPYLNRASRRRLVWFDDVRASTQDVMYPNIIDGKVGYYGCVFFVLFFILIVWFGTNIMTALIIDAYVQAKQHAPKPQPQRKVSILGVGPRIFEDVHREELDMYRSNAQNNPITPFLQARLPAGGYQRSACNRCSDCAVFIAKIESKQICHCGHGKMYHFQQAQTDESNPGSGGAGSTAPLRIGGAGSGGRPTIDSTVSCRCSNANACHVFVAMKIHELMPLFAGGCYSQMTGAGSPLVAGSGGAGESLIDRFKRFKEQQQQDVGTDDGRLQQPLLRELPRGSAAPSSAGTG